MSFFRDLLNFFKYNRSERRAILVLITLIIGVAVFRYVSESTRGTPISEEERASFQSRFSKFEKYLDSLENSATPQAFQIDTARRSDWLKLGLPDWQIDIIENYLEAGGSLIEPSDITKIYGIDSSWFAINHKYILPSREKSSTYSSETKESIEYTEKEKVRTAKTSLRDSIERQGSEAQVEELSFELNSADASKLQSIRGIGEKRASIVINYRKALGGFCSVNQIDELYAIPDEVKLEMKDHAFIDTSLIKKMSFSKTSFKDFMRHPYLDYFYTKLLFEASSKEGFEIGTIRELPEMSDSLYFKLKPYLSK